jgi:hypothetical protein
MRGDPRFQLVEPLALTGDSLADSAALLIDRLGECLAPFVIRRCLAKGLFHVINRRRGSGRAGDWTESGTPK